jgi:hypothetical protein
MPLILSSAATTDGVISSLSSASLASFRSTVSAWFTVLGDLPASVIVDK